MNCSSDCDRGNCPFVNDPQRPTRYICLKCGMERDISNDIILNPLFLLLLIAPVLITMLMNHQSSNPQPELTPSELPSP